MVYSRSFYVSDRNVFFKYIYTYEKNEGDETEADDCISRCAYLRDERLVDNLGRFEFSRVLRSRYNVVKYLFTNPSVVRLEKIVSLRARDGNEAAFLVSPRRESSRAESFSQIGPMDGAARTDAGRLSVSGITR